MILVELQKAGIIEPPSWLPLNTHCLVMMGSVAYGVSSDTSDMDIYGFCIPEKHLVFPHLAGEIPGFGRQIKRFGEWQQHHISVPDAKKQYDFCVFSIVKYFHLLMQNNPNVLDSLFVPQNCILHSTHIGNVVRENRRIFLHKGAYHRFLGFAHSQIAKMGSKNPEEGSKRDQIRQEFGYDTKFGYNLARLADECDQILSLGDIDLQRSKEFLKAIRRGDVSEKELREWFAEREKTLEKLYNESTLQHSPDEGKIKALLLQCLEHHYGSLDKLGYVAPDAAMIALGEIRSIVEKVLKKNHNA